MTRAARCLEPLIKLDVEATLRSQNRGAQLTKRPQHADQYWPWDVTSSRRKA